MLQLGETLRFVTSGPPEYPFLAHGTFLLLSSRQFNDIRLCHITHVIPVFYYRCVLYLKPVFVFSVLMQCHVLLL